MEKVDIKNIQGQVFSPIFDLQKQYASYSKVLEGAKEGEVVTRFPPEPSGYLHIGHVKAALLNYHYAKIYKGKMLLRFDDTNPSKEKLEFVDSIMEDLKTLQVYGDSLSYTSDHFETCMKYCEKALSEGLAYCDDTHEAKMKEEREKRIPSYRRDTPPEENLKIWNDMKAGKADTFCVRAKINMASNNGCMRDPVIYRICKEHHHRTGDKYIVYPTYDFACPIVDAIEGVTHALRTTEYHDRNDQYAWFQEKLGLRKVTIYDYSRLCLVNTCLSKRKLQWFVDSGRVEGWDDPRFPTIRGIMRRGIRTETLIEFMLEQGPSKNTNLMEWDKLWAINRKIIDPIAGRYTAISKEKTAHLTLTNGPKETESKTIPLNKQNPALGDRVSLRSSKLILDFEDAKEIKEGEKITLMNWGNVMIHKITPTADSFDLEGEVLENDTDFKSTKKFTWLVQDPNLVDVELIEYDHLLNAKKIEENVDIKDILNEVSKYTTMCYGDPLVKDLPPKTIVQFERRGYFIVDRHSQRDGKHVVEMIYVPDGKSKGMSLATKVDVQKIAKGGATGENKDAKPKESKKEKKEKEKAEGGDKKEKKAKKEEQKTEDKAPEQKDEKKDA